MLRSGALIYLFENLALAERYAIYIDWLLRAQAADKKKPDGAIVADIVAWNLPTATQASNDSSLGSRSDALGEVKTMQPGKSSYQKGNCQENRPVDQRATQVRRNYKKRAGGLDRTHAPEVVGDGTNGQVGPFEAALGTFYTGNVLPIVVGAFGEVNEYASKLITQPSCSLTAKTDFGKSMMPLATSQPQQERGCLPNYAVPVQARPRMPRMHDSQRAGTAPPQTETLRQTLSTGSVPNSGGQS